MVCDQCEGDILLSRLWRIWGTNESPDMKREMERTGKTEEARAQNNRIRGCSIFYSFHTTELEVVLFLEPGRVCRPSLEFLPGCLDYIVAMIRYGLQWNEGEPADTKGECTPTGRRTRKWLII